MIRQLITIWLFCGFIVFLVINNKIRNRDDKEHQLNIWLDYMRQFPTWVILVCSIVAAPAFFAILFAYIHRVVTYIIIFFRKLRNMIFYRRMDRERERLRTINAMVDVITELSKQEKNENKENNSDTTAN